MGQDDEALKACEAAISDYRDLLKAIPDVPAYREDLARALTNTGQLLHKWDRNPEAKPHLDEALAMCAGLVEEYPLLGRYHKTLALARVSLAQVMRDLGELSQAEFLLRSALETCQMLAEHDPHPEHRELGAVYRSNLARVLHQRGQHDEALAEFDAALEILRTLSQAEPRALNYRDELAWIHVYRGDLLMDMNKPDEAANDYRQVRELRQQLVADSPDPEYRYRLAWFLANCQDVRQRNPAAAVELAKQAVDSTPSNAVYWNALGAAHYRAGQGDESIRALNEAHNRRPGGHCLDWFFLAMAHWEAGDAERTKRDYAQGVCWMETNCPASLDVRRYRTDAQSNMLRRENPHR
jgi:tetratricopeptide (TPR) repeat protein